MTDTDGLGSGAFQASARRLRRRHASFHDLIPPERFLERNAAMLLKWASGAIDGEESGKRAAYMASWCTLSMKSCHVRDVLVRAARLPSDAKSRTRSTISAGSTVNGSMTFSTWVCRGTAKSSRTSRLSLDLERCGSLRIGKAKDIHVLVKTRYVLLWINDQWKQRKQ